MNGTPNEEPGGWSAIGVLAMLGTVVVLLQLAQGRSLGESLGNLGLVATVLLVGAMGQNALRGVDTRPTRTRRRWAWDVVGTVVWLLGMAALTWWYFGRKD